MKRSASININFHPSSLIKDRRSARLFSLWSGLEVNLEKLSRQKERKIKRFPSFSLPHSCANAERIDRFTELAAIYRIRCASTFIVVLVSISKCILFFCFHLINVGTNERTASDLNFLPVSNFQCRHSFDRMCRRTRLVLTPSWLTTARERKREVVGDSSGIALLFYSLYLPRPSTHRHTYHARHYLSYPSCVREAWLTTDVFRQRETERGRSRERKYSSPKWCFSKTTSWTAEIIQTHTYQ